MSETEITLPDFWKDRLEAIAIRIVEDERANDDFMEDSFIECCMEAFFIAIGHAYRTEANSHAVYVFVRDVEDRLLVDFHIEVKLMPRSED